jgi:hypothetical protein
MKFNYFRLEMALNFALKVKVKVVQFKTLILKKQS